MATVKKRKSIDLDEPSEIQIPNLDNPPRPDDEDASTTPPPKRLLSCQRCRSKKVKCNFENPCALCLKAGVECVQVVNDNRKKRPGANYVTSLENKFNTLSELFTKLQSLDPAKQRELIELTDLDEIKKLSSSHKSPSTSAANSNLPGTPSSNDDDNKIRSPNHIENNGNGDGSSTSTINNSSSRNLHHNEDSGEAVYGPTSVFVDNVIQKQKKSNANAKNAATTSTLSIKLLNKDEDILHCIKLFFTWQYPEHNMFIFREAFLIDFFNPEPHSLYCSKILVFSICALGAKMSKEDRIYNKSKQYYFEAKSLLLSQLSQPSITSLQSFLLLAFYDICNGFNSSGWMLSGNAMRMGFDLGFQLNPKVWFLQSKDKLSPLDVKIRSRVYWGCYVADHFICLLLGRPSLLKLSDATIPETNDLPDLEWIDEYTYQGYIKRQNRDSKIIDPSYISNPLKKMINLINISDNMLNDIFTKSEEDNDESNNEDLDLVSRFDKLNEYNILIKEWKDSLPDDLQWDRDSLRETGDNPTFTSIRFYYYILILCLNRPFVGKPWLQDSELSPVKICNETIQDLHVAINTFQKINGTSKTSIFMVYCAILSISIILLTNSSTQLVDETKEQLQFFMNVLYGSSRTWKLAEKSYRLVKVKLKKRNEEVKRLESKENNEKTRHKRAKLRNELKKQTSNDSKNSSDSTPVSGQSPIIDKNQQILTTTNDLEITPTNNAAEEFPNPVQYDGGVIDQSGHKLDEIQFQYPIDQNFAAQSMHGYVNNASENNTNVNNGAKNNNNSVSSINSYNNSIVESNTDILFDDNLDFLGGPPVLMTSDLFDADWESLFPDNVIHPKT